MTKFALAVVAAFFSIVLMATTTTPASAAGALSQTRHIQSGLVADGVEPVHYRKRRSFRFGVYGGPFFSFQIGRHRGYHRHYHKRRHYHRHHRRHYHGRRNYFYLHLGHPRHGTYW